MSRINTGAFLPWNATACANGTTLTSEWISVSRAAELQVYLRLLSAAGSPNHTLSIHYSPKDYHYLNSVTATTADYVAITIVSASTSEIMQQFDKSGVADLAYPPRAVRLSIVGEAAANADSVVTCYLLWKE